MARRRRFHRTAPDRGWIVGQMDSAMSEPAGDPDYQVGFWTLFDFADVDPDSLGRIEKDHSDWYIKRVILHLTAAAQLDGLDIGDTARLFQWGVGTVGVENAQEMEDNDFGVFTGEGYNLWSRLMQTGVMPAYHTPALPLAIGNPSNNTGLGVVNLDQIPASGGGDPVGYVLTTHMWGPAHQQHDFTVSNAGLRNNQVFGIAIALSRSVTGHAWDQGDTLAIGVHYQVLLQKRRA